MLLYPYILISQVYTSRVEEIWASRNRETYISLYVTSFKKKKMNASPLDILLCHQKKQATFCSVLVFHICSPRGSSFHLLSVIYRKYIPLVPQSFQIKLSAALGSP